VGRGDSKAADGAAVKALRSVLSGIEMKGRVVIGEGERDEAPMLFIGEEVGNGKGLEVDIAVDPLECTDYTAHGRGGAISVMAVAPKGHLLHAPDTYMNKLAVGPKAKGAVDLDAPVSENVKAVARALGKDVSEVSVLVMDRERNEKFVKEVRGLGARAILITDGDVAGGISTCVEGSGVDMLLGIGAAPEGVLAASAIKCLGGELQGRLWFKNDAQRESALKRGFKDLDRKLGLEDLVKGNESAFIATGVTTGPFLQGVHENARETTTQSIVINSKTKTIQVLNSRRLKQ
ncbi:MAG TPA: class II fructose-bisphosphatase, partial [archaeon]|nr:class II fructose-bisphosphatase [archaeon]